MTTTVAMRGKGSSVGGVLLQLLPWALLFLLFAAVGILHVASRVLVVDAGYTLSRLEHEGQKLELENRKLKIELTLLKSPAKLEQVAREKLGMGPVPAGAMVAVRAVRADPAASARAEPGRGAAAANALDRKARASRSEPARPDSAMNVLANVRSPNG